MKHILMRKRKKEKCSERGEIIYDPVILSQGQFCMIIIRLLKTLKLILANTTWFKVLQDWYNYC